jgi:hypothetical protein
MRSIRAADGLTTITPEFSSSGTRKSGAAANSARSNSASMLASTSVSASRKTARSMPSSPNTRSLVNACRKRGKSESGAGQGIAATSRTSQPRDAAARRARSGTSGVTIAMRGAVQPARSSERPSASTPGR